MKKLRILVVDDDHDFAEGIADALELEGHETAIAHCGEDALETYTEAEFDLIFMDMKLPGRTGVESIREFQRRFPGARVVLMTAYSLDNLIDETIERNVLAMFHKPLAFNQVQALLARVQEINRVLIVDDDVDFAREMRDLLEVAGYSVRSCFDGATAVQRCLHEPFDAMILDLRMPGLSGREVCRTVRAALPAFPIIAVTGGDEDDLALEGPAAPGHILRKPFSPSRLLQLLRAS